MKKPKNKFTVPLTRRETIPGWLYFAFMLLFLPSLISELFSLAGKVGTLLEVNFIYYVLNFFAMLSIFFRFLGENLKNAGKNLWRFLLAAVVGLSGYQLVYFLQIWLYNLIAPDFSNVNDSTIHIMVGENYFLVGLCTVLLVPVTEECLYRGLMFRGLYERNPLAAYLVSIFAFAAVHIMGYIGSCDFKTLILCFLQYVPAGAFLAWAYRYSNSIFAPILIHTAVNLTGMLALR